VLETDSTLLDLSWDDKKIHRIAMVMMLGRGIFVVHWIRIHCCSYKQGAEDSIGVWRISSQMAARIHLSTTVMVMISITIVNH